MEFTFGELGALGFCCVATEPVRAEVLTAMLGNNSLSSSDNKQHSAWQESHLAVLWSF